MIKDLETEFLFTGKVMVERSFRHTGLLQDRLDAGGIVTVARNNPMPARIISLLVSFVAINGKLDRSSRKVKKCMV